jgi:outer membrane lipoprotein-sorting protein
MKSRILIPFLFLSSLTFANAADVKSGEDVLRVMHDRYAKTWYKTLTFTQKSTTYNADGTSKAKIWHEALAVPAKLRIDIGPPADNNGYLMVDGSLTVLKAGKEVANRPRVNMLLVLGFDVYGQSPEATAKVAKDEGFDLTKVHEDTWEGRPVYVVGAEKGDLKAKQFWIDENRGLFVRLFEPTQSDATKFQDVRFEDYREMAGGWVAARVEVHVDDKIVFSEDYTDIQCNTKLDAGTFDPRQFSATHWEKP